MSDNQEPNEDFSRYIAAALVGAVFGCGALFLIFLYGFFALNLGVSGSLSHAFDEWYIMFGLGAILGVALFWNNISG